MLDTPDTASFAMPLTVTVTCAPSGGHSSSGDTESSVIVGATASNVTVTVNVVLAVLGVGSAVSLAEQVTIVVPVNLLPGGGEHETGLGPETASTAVGSG